MKMTLRTQIIGLVLVAVIPFTVASMFLFIYFWNMESHDAETLTHERAQAVSKEIGVLLMRYFTVIDQLGLVYNDVSPDIGLRTRLLDNFLALHNEITDVVVVNSRGKETDHRSNANNFSSQDLSDRSQNVEFAAIKEKGYYLGPVYLSQQKSFFLIGEQIIQPSDHASKGAVFILINASILYEKLKKISAEIKGSSIYIVNDKGAVITHPNPSYLIEGKDFSHVSSVRLAITKNTISSSSYYNERSEKVIGAGVPVTIAFSEDKEFATNWFVITEIPVSFALASAVRMRTVIFEVVAILFLIVAGAGVVMLKRFSVPLHFLRNVFEQVDRGDLNDDAPESSNIGKNIFTDFNEFSDHLTQSVVSEQEGVPENNFLKTVNLKKAQLYDEKTLSDFKKIVHESCMIYRAQAERMGVSLIEKKTRAKIPLVLVNVNAMKVVLKNLIEYAIYHAPAKGNVTVALKHNGDKLHVLVIDLGIDTAGKERDQLFTRFFKGKEAFNVETTGNDLGLYAVKKIIEAHDGNVWVYSQPNKSLTFGFEIPV